MAYDCLSTRLVIELRAVKKGATWMKGRWFVERKVPNSSCFHWGVSCKHQHTLSTSHPPSHIFHIKFGRFKGEAFDACRNKLNKWMSSFEHYIPSKVKCNKRNGEGNANTLALWDRCWNLHCCLPRHKTKLRNCIHYNFSGGYFA